MTRHDSDDGYRPDQVEAKWRARWAERGTNEPDLDRAERPFYNLMMFPYPSAEGLHVGNVFAFTGADNLAIAYRSGLLPPAKAAIMHAANKSKVTNVETGLPGRPKK